jgi:hypothetical protein
VQLLQAYFFKFSPKTQNTVFLAVFVYLKFFLAPASCFLNTFPAARLAAWKATAVGRMQSHPSFMPHSTVAVLGSTLSLFNLV